MKLRIYLDTSVFSALYDDRVTERRGETEEFWERRGQFEIATSELAREELDQTPDPARRTNLRLLLDEGHHPYHFDRNEESGRKLRQRRHVHGGNVQ